MTDDIYLIFLITLSIFVVMVIVFSKIVDKKMSNIAIKLPPFPQPNVEVKIQKQCGSNEYTLYSKNKTEKQKDRDLIINPKTENFTDVMKKEEEEENMITPEVDINPEENDDIIDKFKNPPIKFYPEDGVRGYNILKYDYNAKIEDIGKINLTNLGRPKPNGYIF